MSALSTNRDEVLGFAEGAYSDPTCVAFLGLTSQVLKYEAFIWQPHTGEIRVLHPRRRLGLSGF
jgi:hypothetical protein